MTADSKPHWRRLSAACLAVIAAGFLAPRLISSPELVENRTLAAPPGAPRTWATLRAWPKAADAYFEDHFPARSQLIGGLNFLRYRLGVSGSDRVIVGRDGWLFYDNGTQFGTARNKPAFTDASAEAWLLGLAGRTEWLKARGAHYLVLVGPDKEVIFPQQGPIWFQGPDPNRSAALLARVNETAQAGEMVYPAPALQQQARWGLNVYSPVETHWTGLGAYYAYAALMQRLEALGAADGPKPLAAFRETSEPFKPRNLALMLGVSSFVDVDFPEFLDPGPKPQTIFLTRDTAWTAPQMIETGVAGKPVLLMMRDSFSNALLPFLEGHFSRIVLAHNQDGAWRPDLIERFKPDVVLSEVVESGLPWLMSDSPPASEPAQARIAQALAAPHRIEPKRPPAKRERAKRLDGGPGTDVLIGSDGPDVINGRAGDDRIEAGAGADTVYGGQGNDVINAGDGDDWLTGNRGDDTLVGGRGADIFHSSPGSGLDLMLDFSAAEGDRVELDRGTSHVVRQEGADTVIELTGARMVLRGIRAANLPPDWLVLR